MANIQHSVNQALQSFQFGMAFMEKRPQIKELQNYHEAASKAEAYKAAYDKDAMNMKNAQKEWATMLANPTKTPKKGDYSFDRSTVKRYKETSGNYANILNQMKSRFPKEWAKDLEANEGLLKEASEQYNAFKNYDEIADKWEKKGVKESIIAMFDKYENTQLAQTQKAKLEQEGGSN